MTTHGTRARLKLLWVAPIACVALLALYAWKRHQSAGPSSSNPPRSVAVGDPCQLTRDCAPPATLCMPVEKEQICTLPCTGPCPSGRCLPLELRVEVPTGEETRSGGYCVPDRITLPIAKELLRQRAPAPTSPAP